MIVKTSSILSYFDALCPTDMYIRIYQKNSIFGAEVQVSGLSPEIFDIGLTFQEVEELNKTLQQAVQIFANEYEANDDSSDNALSQLAEAGRAAFHRIFARGKPRTVILEALKILRAKANPTIEISAEHFFVPWELLYNGPVDGAVDVDLFWGMHYILARNIIQDTCFGGMVLPTIETPRPNVGLVICDELDQVVEKEHPALKILHTSKRIKLQPLHALNPAQRPKELAYFGRFLSKKMHIVHFACHAYLKDPLDLSYLRVSDSFNITMREIYSHEFIIRYHPLVIMNACHTGVIHPLSTSSWAALFRKYGARGVLATEFRVPDDFAAAFVVELYQHLLAGKPIGLALLITRRLFWDAHQRNPLGLAYALYSSHAVKIAS